MKKSVIVVCIVVAIAALTGMFIASHDINLVTQVSQVKTPVNK